MMQALHKLLLCHLLACLGPNALGSEIIHGQIAPRNQMLYMASVQTKEGHHCGGSLISNNFVLTAAHCDNDQLVKVVLGTHNLRNTETERSIMLKCKHPKYRRHTTGSDIMLLKVKCQIWPKEIPNSNVPEILAKTQHYQSCYIVELSQSVPVGRTIQRIRLPPPDMNLRPNQMCRVAGWGWTEDSNQHRVTDLRVVRVSVVDQNVCRRQWSKTLNLPANVICAGGYKTLEGACRGDSGGPLVFNEVAAGVVSFGDKDCNDTQFPNVYTDVSKFRPWIDQILKENGC